MAKIQAKAAPLSLSASLATKEGDKFLIGNVPPKTLNGRNLIKHVNYILFAKLVLLFIYTSSFNLCFHVVLFVGMQAKMNS